MFISCFWRILLHWASLDHTKTCNPDDKARMLNLLVVVNPVAEKTALALCAPFS